MTTRVVYARYKLNGDSEYPVEFSEATMKMGTFHSLDGMRVKIFYRGNKNTKEEANVQDK